MHKLPKSLNKGLFTLAEALEAGISQPTISRMVKSGLLIRVKRGIFRLKQAQIDHEHLDFILATKLFGPRAVIGLWSALFYYGLIENVPEQIWMLVPQSVRTTDKRFRCVRVGSNLSIGVKHFKDYSITTLERTIAECFRYSTKVGLDTAIRAARLAIKQELTTPSKILRTAKQMNVERFLLKHWESITLE